MLEGEASDTVQVTSGVPQGSVLGPTSFYSTLMTYQIFADDAIVHCTISDPSDCRKLQGKLDKLSNWEMTWLM